MGSKKKTGYKCRIAIVVLLLLASIAALVAVAVIQHSWAAKEYGTEYGIVIDSGSSRSNVYVYSWPGEKENETGVVTEIMNCRVGGAGISETKLGQESDNETWSAMHICMAKVMATIPVGKHKATPLFLGATAGMRLLELKDAEQSQGIVTSLKKYLGSLPFDFKHASIISGQEEGLYGWVTANYLMGNFLQKNLWNAYIRPEGKTTVGSMDLGGASTQIAFAVEDDYKGDDYLLIKLYGYSYNVYTHSFLCYGKNEAEKTLLDKVLKQSTDPKYVVNPCYPKDFSINMSASSIYDTECTTKPENYDAEQNYLMVGTGDSDKCESLVKSLFDFKTCTSPQCSFNGVEQPPVTGNFLAYAGFFFIARALLFNGTSDIDDFNKSVVEFCQTPWKVLRAEKHWISDKYLKTYCYAAHYVYTLLADGYKFDKETWKNIVFTREVESTSIGWSLGYMLTMSNMIPSDVKKIPPMTDPLFAGLIFLFSALTIVTVVFVFIIIIRTCY